MTKKNRSLHPTLGQLNNIGLLLVLLLSLERRNRKWWKQQFKNPGWINIPKIVFTYSLCLAAVLLLFAPAPGMVNIYSLAGLWGGAWMLTIGVYMLLPG
jgi:hypothetical protein